MHIELSRAPNGYRFGRGAANRIRGAWDPRGPGASQNRAPFTVRDRSALSTAPGEAGPAARAGDIHCLLRSPIDGNEGIGSRRRALPEFSPAKESTPFTGVQREFPVPIGVLLEPTFNH